MANEDINFTFDLSVSTQAFPQKPQANVVKDIVYTTQTLTIDELEQRVKDGHAFCYNFLPTPSGVLTQQDRHIENFDYTKTIFYDFDKMPVPMEDFIETLAYKPSLAYTTYSNGANGKYGYRLVYTFRLSITNEQEFEKTYKGLAAANGFEQCTYPDGTKYGLDYRKVNQQYYGGGEHTTTWKSYNTYFANTFYPYYQPITQNDNIPFKNKILKDVDTSCSYLESGFEADLRAMKPSDFIDKYMHGYEENYLKSLSSETTLSEDKSYYILSSDYMEIKHRIGKDDNGRVHVQRWHDGQERRKKLYIAAKIMLHNQPDMTIEQLVYNLMRERQDFYDNTDGALHIDNLIKIAKNAFAYKDIHFTKPFKHAAFRVNKEYWKEKGMTANQAKQVIKKELHLQDVLNVYDFSLSVKENLELCKQHGIKVGKSYLYKIRKQYGDNTSCSVSDKELMEEHVITNTDNIPFKNKDIEDVYTSCSQMENENEGYTSTISCSYLERVSSIPWVKEHHEQVHA